MPARLDAFVPVPHFNEVHGLHVAAPPERVFDAITAVTADEILFFRTPRRRFASYWRAISPGRALIRRTWLRAIGKRAETAADAAATPGTARRTRRRA